MIRRCAALLFVISLALAAPAAAQPVMPGAPAPSPTPAPAQPAPMQPQPGAPPAAAAGTCGSGKVIFQDDFSTADPSWGQNQHITIKDGAMSIYADAGRVQLVQSQSDFYADAAVCATLAVPAPTKSDDAPRGGILFWGGDYSNLYGFEISSDGHYRMFRLSRDRWLYPINWTASEAFKKGDATNTIEVQTRGRSATFWINGTRVAQVNGIPPDGGGLVGLFAEGTGSDPTTVRFTHFAIAQPRAQ